MEQYAASRLISDLKKLGLLVQTGFDGRRRYLKPIYTASTDKTASEKSPMQRIATAEKIQPTPFKKSNADSDFAAVPLSTIDVQNNLHKNSFKKVDKEKGWEEFLKWSSGRVSPTTWTIISQCDNPSTLSGQANIYWKSWKGSS